MSTANGLVTVEAVINPALYWVIKAKSKEYLIVGIYGITPQAQENQLQSNDQFIRLLECWKRDNEGIKKLFIGRKVEFIQSKLIDGVPFGNLFVSFGSFRLDVCHYLLDAGIAYISQYSDRDCFIIKYFSIRDVSQLLSRLRNKALEDVEVPKIRYPKKKNLNSSLSSSSSSLTSFTSPSRSSSVNSSFHSHSDPSTWKSSDASSISSERLKKYRNNGNLDSSSSIDCSPLRNVDVPEEHLVFVDQFVRGNITNCTQEKLEFVKESLQNHKVEDINQHLVNIMSMKRESPPQLKPMGRGKMLKTIMEKSCPLSSSSTESLSSIEKPKHALAPLPPQGKLRKVFSMDMYGATAHVDESGQLVDRAPPQELDFNADCSLSSSTSTESLADQRKEQPNLITEFESNLSLTDNSDRDENQDLLERELIPINQYLDRLVAFGGLIHGDTCVLPKNQLYSMGLHPYVMEALEKARMMEVSRAGAFVMPAILTRRSTVLIGPPMSRKTTSVAISLVSLLLEERFYESLRPGCGPRAVIIVPFAETVRTTAKLISIANPGYLITLTTCGGGMELERRVDLTNGCDILISTPRCWLRLLQHRFVTNQKRLCHLFVDQVNVVIDLFKTEFLEIMKLAENVGAANRVYYQQQVAKAESGENTKSIPNPIEPQVILVGDHWDPVLEKIVLSRLKSPLLCLTSHLEAALYARVRPCIHFIKPNINKENKLISILQGKEKMRTVIACSTSADVRHLRPILCTKRKHVLIAHGDLHHSMLRDIHATWNSDASSEALLIVSDDVLNDLGVNNAQALIHYNMPDSKTHFSNRFTAIRLCFTDRILHPEAVKSSCSVDMMIDEENAEQFPEIVSFMERLGAKIPDDLQSAANRIKKIKESKKTTLLCKNVIMFGQCWKEIRCKDRHIMHVEKDKCRPGIPQKGAIYYELLHVFSAAHFSVRLVSHSVSGNLSELQPLPFSKEYVHICMRMNAYYSIRDNRRVHGDVRVGDLVAIETETDTTFQRAMITKIVSKDNRQSPAIVNVKLIDFGTSEDKKVTDLLFLPKDLQDCSPQSCELFICGLLPVDKDISWSYATTSIIKKELKQLDKSLMLISEIVYTIGGKIIIKDMKAMEYLEDTHVWVTELSVKQKLLTKHLAEKNPNHLQSLFSLTSDAGLIAPVLPVADSCLSLVNVGLSESSNVSGPRIENQEKLISWAFLLIDEISVVNFTFAEDPSLVFVTNYKFTQQLLSLEKDIASFMDKKVLRCINRDLYPGYICLAKTSSNSKWNRGKIVEMGVELSDSGEPLYKIYFVDYGDIDLLPISEIAPCPNKFITALPFQAIECDLTGLLPFHNGWSTECTDLIYEWTAYTNEEGLMLWKILHIKVTKSTPVARVTGGKHYSVIMVDNYSTPATVLNKNLLTGGYANWNPDEKKFLADEYLANIINEFSAVNEPEKVDEEEKPVNSSKYGDEVLDVEELLRKVSLNEFEYVSPNIGAPLDPNNLPPGIERKNLKALESLQSSSSEVTAATTIKSTSESEADRKSTTSNTGLSKFLKFSKNRKQKRMKALEESQMINTIQKSDKPILVWDNGVLTPQSVWRQNFAFVFINILIPDVNKYYLETYRSYIYFSTVVNKDRFYRLEIDLFGPVDAVYHEAKGQYILVKLKKTVVGVVWPRLTYNADGSGKWLKEHVIDFNDEDEDIMEKLIQIGEDKMKLGLTTGNRLEDDYGEIGEESSGSSEDDDSAEEFLKESDPYNPLG